MSELDDQTQALVQQLYHAWSTNADSTSYAPLRDQLLAQRERIETCVTTLKAVISVTCPQVAETERHFDPKWDELFALAECIESQDEEEGCTLGKHKRTYNKVYRLRNLAVVSALWSPGVVHHYGWDVAAQGCLRLLKTCAMRFPHFSKQFCPYVNRVLLDRHREAIVSGRLKTLNEAPLQIHRDLKILVGGGVVPDLEAEELWVTSSDGAVPVDASGRLLKDMRPCHVSQHLLMRDSYGMLIPRAEGDDAPVICNTGTDFSTQWSVYDQFLAQGDFFLPTITGLPITPVEQLTPSRVDSLLDSLSSSYRAANPFETSIGTSSITSVSGDSADLEWSLETAPITFDTFNSGPTAQDHGEDDMRGNKRRKGSRSTSHGENIARSSRARKEPRLRSRPSGACNPQKRKTSMEDEIRDRYSQMLSTYGRRISNEVVPGNKQREMRSQWLTPDITWARIWSDPRATGLRPGTAASEAECDIVYSTAEALVAAAQAGEEFSKPVVIKESFSDANMHSYERFLSMLEDASSSDELVDVRCIDIEHAMYEGLGKFTRNLRSRGGHSDADGLWMATARSVAKCHRPLFTMLNRFRLLESLSEGLHDLGSVSAPSPLLRAMSVSLNTISFLGSFSGAYLNTLAGFWQRILSGAKLWMFVPETEMPPDELAGVANDVRSWLPRGKQRLVVLEENDVLFVPPGLRLIQVWHSPMTCLTEQGMLWDDLSVLSIVESLTWRHEHQNDRASRQLPRMIHNLGRLISEQPDRFRKNMDREEFIGRFREAVEPLIVSWRRMNRVDTRGR